MSAPSRRPGSPGPRALMICLVLAFFPAGCATTSASPARNQYLQAEACRRDLDANPGKQAQRSQWLFCAETFVKVYALEPNGPWAAAGLYQAGLTRADLYRRSGRAEDRAEALDLFRRITLKYPNSAYVARARAAAAGLAGPAPAPSPVKAARPPEIKESVKKKTRRTGAGDFAAAPVCPPTSPAPRPKAGAANGKIPAKSLDEPMDEASPGGSYTSETGRMPGSGAVKVTGLRFWTSPNYTRVVIDTDDEVSFGHHLLRENREIGKPPRLFVDLSGARVGRDLVPVVAIEDDLLSSVRAGQHDAKTVRVVVDIKSFESYKVFPLKNPFRVVIDLRGERGEAGARAGAPPGAFPAGKPGQAPGVEPGALARQLALKVRRIVIDPGHGGKDAGAPGAAGGVREKDVVLKLARKLARRVREKTGCEVVLTRDSDHFIALEERTAIANSREADLFVSIHTNACNNKAAHGVETYILNLAADEESIQVAARENATSRKSVSDLQGILRDLMTNAKIDESTRLACAVQESLVGALKKKYSHIQDKGVKQAPFYVLLGARMPSILVETSFISNQRECQRLTNAAYQDTVVEGIARGIERYVNGMNHASR